MKSFEDYSHLQLDIDCISDLVSRNKLMLNPTKCKAMTISRKRNSVYPAQFLLNGIPLEHVETFKYTKESSSPLIFHGLHTLISSVYTKARKVIGLLYRRFYGNVDNHSLLELYSVLVRPHLEYAEDPHLIKDTNKLENVKKFAIKMCLKQWDLGTRISLTLFSSLLLRTVDYT